MSRPVSNRVQALLLVSILPLLGCSRIERAEQCRELARTVNPRLGEIRALGEGTTQPPDSLREIAERYDGIADDLGPLEFHSRSLAGAVQEYGKQLRALAAEARALAEAVEAKDKGAHSTARLEVKARSSQLRMAQRRIEDSCR